MADMRVDINDLPMDTGICSSCIDHDSCPMTDMLSSHRRLVEIYETDHYEDIDPGSWDEYSIDEPMLDQDGVIWWCPMYSEDSHNKQMESP